MKDSVKLLTITIEDTRRTIEILYKWETDICTNYPQETIWLPVNYLFKYYAEKRQIELVNSAPTVCTLCVSTNGVYSRSTRKLLSFHSSEWA